MDRLGEILVGEARVVGEPVPEHEGPDPELVGVVVRALDDLGLATHSADGLRDQIAAAMR